MSSRDILQIIAPTVSSQHFTSKPQNETLLLAIFGQILALKPPQGFKKTAKN